MQPIHQLSRKVFHFIIIKPSHYDEDGYVIQWAQSSIPSNSLAVLYGAAMDCADRRALGDDVDIAITACDESNTRVKVDKIVKKVQASGGHGLIALAGVQSNQFPRAVDIARQFRSRGLPVCIGGFHVSGCMAMLPVLPPDLQECVDLGISLFAGEAEGRLEDVLRDAYRNRLQPIYNHLSDLPDLTGAPVPYLPPLYLKKTKGASSSFDAGRGCPFLCSFCTIINVQGRKSRHRSPDDVERIVRRNAANGITYYFITDDNLARNTEWEAIFDRLIWLREAEGITVRLGIQVDTLCHKIPRFIEKAGRAGVILVFIGLESINPDSLKGARKEQNRITEYHAMFQAWQNIGAIIGAGYILGFPNDTRESILQDIAIIQRELPIHTLNFFILTPLPGSADHKKLYDDGVPMDSDMNRFDSWHVVTDHPRMSRQAWQDIYWEAWDAYYTPEHIETILRRARPWGSEHRRAVLKRLLSFYASVKLERVNPLEGGVFRRKYRRDRRPGMPRENPLVFYPRYLGESLVKYLRFLWMNWQYNNILRHVENEPEASVYTDVSLQPVRDHDYDELGLFTETASARAFVDRVRRKRAAQRL